MNNRLKIVAGLAVAALGLSACGNGGGESEQAAAGTLAPDTTQTCTEDRVGGEITIGEFGMLTTFAPGQGQFGVFGGTQSAAVFDRLMRWDPEAEEFVPQLAESLEPNDDHTEWTLTLPEGATFSNGDDLTAEDVAFTVDLHQDPGTQSMAFSEAANVDDIRAEHPLTVRFTLTEPWEGFPMLLAGAAGETLPRDHYEATDPEDWARAPIGAGAFVVDSYIPDQETVLVPNPDYHGGVVCPTLRFTRIAGGQPTLDALNTGEFQSGFLRGARYVSEAKNQGHPGYESITSAGSVLNMNTGTGGYDGILTEATVRQAVSQAIDRSLYDNRTTGGLGQPSAALLADSSRFYDGAEGLDHDPELATRLVEQARTDHPDWDGSLTLLIGDAPENQEAGIVVQSMLNAVGFDVALESVPRSQNAARSIQGDYELSLGGLSPSDADPSAQFIAAMTPGGATSNRTGIDDPRLTEALAATKTAPDFESRKQAYRDVQEIFNELAPFVVLANSEDLVVIDESVRGVVPTLHSTMLYDAAFTEDR